MNSELQEVGRAEQRRLRNVGRNLSNLRSEAVWRSQWPQNLISKWNTALCKCQLPGAIPLRRFQKDFCSRIRNLLMVWLFAWLHPYSNPMRKTCNTDSSVAGSVCTFVALCYGKGLIRKGLPLACLHKTSFLFMPTSRQSIIPSRRMICFRGGLPPWFG